MNRKKEIIIVSSVVIFIIALVVVILTLKNKPNTYKVTFDTNGGTQIQEQIINEGEVVKKPIDPTKEGYMFVEWLYQDQTYDFSLAVKSDLSLTAKWVEVKEDVETFVVKFETEGGTTIPNQIIEKGNKVSKPADPVKEGYNFKGWLLNGEAYDFESNVESDLVIKASWEKVEVVENNTPNNTTNNNATNTKPSTPTTPTTPTVKKYTVTFNSNGGSGVASQTVEEGGKASKPSNPTKSGHTFAGWTLNGSTYDFSTPVTGNITLLAKWTEIVKNKYTVTFNSNGGSSVASQTVEEGNKASKPGDPTRSGHTFAGWTLNGSTYDFSKAVTANITLVAKWNQKSYTIKISAVDDYSPARVLSVYENGTKITAKEIRYSDGVYLCSGSNPNVNKNAIAGETSFIVVLSDGTQVTAKAS